MEKLHGHTLEYWKNNAEEDYLKVPISVLKYITCLEERIEQFRLLNGKKEVISFEEWLFVNNYKKLYRRRNKTDTRTIDYFVKDAISFAESELMQIYNEKVMSL